jgi:RNA methyltransferase, TrmH family
MLVNSQVKYIQSLGHKKFRDADGVFVAEGPKIVLELLQSDICSLVYCFATAGWKHLHEAFLKGREHLFVETEEKELERISMLVTPNQVLAVFTKPHFREIQKPGGLILLLDTIQDPGNLGTILRTADWFGVQRIVCSPDTADVFNPKVVQAAMGSIIRVEMIYTDLTEYIRANPGIPIYASSLEGEDLRENLPLSNALLLMGNESKGIRPELEALATKRIRIPRKGGAESLNVAVATGILLSRFETVTQTQSLSPDSTGG